MKFPERMKYHSPFTQLLGNGGRCRGCKEDIILKNAWMSCAPGVSCSLTGQAMVLASLWARENRIRGGRCQASMDVAK